VNYSYTGIKYDKLVEIEKRKFDFSKIKIELDEKLQKVEDQIASIEGSVVSFSDFDESDSNSHADIFGQSNQVADLVKDMMSDDGEDETDQKTENLDITTPPSPPPPPAKTEKDIAKEEKQRRLEEARKAKEREARLRALHEEDHKKKGKKGFFGKVINWF
jgi:type IV secretory pathway VirB10-like protein